MTRKPWSARVGMLLGFMVIISLPLMLGQGCPGMGTMQPVVPQGNLNAGQTTSGESATGNVSPIFTFETPSTDVSVEVGQIIHISWTCTDPDSNAAIALLADPDNIYGNGNERVILPLVMEDSGTDTFAWNTAGVSPGTYRIIARVNDSVNPEVIAVATGRALLLGAGYTVGNLAPAVTMTEPDINIALAQGETTQLAYCGHDTDGGPTGDAADVIIMLDTNQDMTDDLDLTGPDRENNLLLACGPGGFPRQVGGVTILGCAKDDGCTNLANATTFDLTLDLAQIPPRSGGEPYWPRVTMWDHTNAPISSYSRGNIGITSLGSGIIDLGQVGRSISGAKFYGFDAHGWAGSNGAGIGDLNGDGVDDFVIVSRFGLGLQAFVANSATVPNVGAAHVIMGRRDVKFGGAVSLNSIGTSYPGSIFMMPETTATQGITSVCPVGDIDGDGRPEILFGMPYVEIFNDSLVDDPCACPCESPDCYGPDGLPNPQSAVGPCGPASLLDADWNEAILCTNDFDLSVATPLNGGYAVLVSSQTGLDSRSGPAYNFGNVGQGKTYVEGLASVGARFRGGWYDKFDMSTTTLPSYIIPDNQFGQTVSTMPVMTDSSLDISPRYGPALLIAAPNGYRGRGLVTLTPPEDFTQANTFSAAESFPYYVPASCNCGQGVARGIVYPGLDDSVGTRGPSFIIGAAVGDHLGYAAPAGDFNLDGNRDILMGAPGAERNGVSQRGIVYVLYGRSSFPAELDLQILNPPRMEIWGDNANDRFGYMQTIVGDVNQDGLPDIGFSSQYASGPGGAEAGFVGVILGGRLATGENNATTTFTVSDVAGPKLPGFRIYGTQPGGHLGAVINNAGDFNGDGVDDLLICAPDEIRQVNGQNRRGVAYVVFGGAHLVGGSFFTNQVSTPQLPGVVFVSPFADGSADEAPIDWICTAGDVNGDGFADVLVGVSHADFVNPLDPGQRRQDSGAAYLVYGNNAGTNQLNP